ncbi:MAG TPA: PBS lyase [Syntrophaceae bacterium]|nr:PBS lyase [Syntrophaceae bacterium]
MNLNRLAEPPRCPFCGTLIDRPRELKTRKLSEFPLGSCKCGAIYAYDVTGHNIGAAMVEALVFACNGDWDLAWQLSSGEDYQDARIERYDDITHQVIPGGSLEGRRVWGVLLFVKLHEEIQEVTQPGVEAKLAQATPIPPPQVKRWKSFSKREVQKLVEENRLQELIDMAKQDTRVIMVLHRLLYSADEQMRWQAVEMLGKVAGEIADIRPRSISDLIRRLLYSCTDSAASSWGALEAIGEIISIRPDMFGGFTPPLLSFLEDDTSRMGVLWAVGRIGKTRPDLVRKTIPHLISFLNDPEPSIRGHAAWALGMISVAETKEELKKLRNDHHAITIYENEKLQKKTVGFIARESIEKIG